MENINPIVIIIAALVIVVGIMILLRRNKNTDAVVTENHNNKIVHKEYKDAPVINDIVPLQQLPADRSIDETKLMEITDSSLVSHITNIVPSMLPVLTNANSAMKLNEVADAIKEGKMYYAILEKSGELADSKAGDRMKRAFSIGENGIDEHANLKEVVLNISPNDAMANIASSAFGVAAMVVGQHYMEQINSQLDEISSGLSRISDFQNNEYKSKVIFLITRVKQIACFQGEILASQELRKHEILNLQNLENDCAQLLQQANITIDKFTNDKKMDYDEYSNQVKEISEWASYQITLVSILSKIGDLKYALYLGQASKLQCFALYNDYFEQVEGIRTGLIDWHNSQIDELKIQLGERKRQRQGLSSIAFKIPGMINDDLNYKAIDDGTVNMINSQTNNENIYTPLNSGSSLYEDDVELIVKDGKVFYLPNN